MLEQPPTAIPSDGSRPRKPRYAVRVQRVVRVTPRMVRVTFAGEDLAGFTWSGPASHIKLIFETGAMRTYTPRRFDREARELDVVFVVHGEGPASAWAEQAAVGQSLTVAGPGRSYSVDPAADWYLLVGDDAAIPAIGTILEALPPGARVLLILEVVDAAEEHSLEAHGPRAEIRWVQREAAPSGAGRQLEAAVRRLELPAGSGRIYVACEADAMRRIRRHLLAERHFPRTQLVTRGYWRQGETDHPDRDYGEDVA